MHVKKGDKVTILKGKDAGKTGEVLKAMPKENRIVVAGLNKMKKHMRPTRQGGKGQVVEIEMSLNASNVEKAK
jgi:large subunit ribosomal protein L24